MAANKPGKAEILAAFFDDGTYSPLFTDGAVSAAYGCIQCPIWMGLNEPPKIPMVFIAGKIISYR